MYIFERARAGKAITFRNKRRYGCHNSETVRSVYTESTVRYDETESVRGNSATSKTGPEVSNECRNNDTGFTSLPLMLLRTSRLIQLESAN